jgi:hypothetical protein
LFKVKDRSPRRIRGDGGEPQFELGELLLLHAYSPPNQRRRSLDAFLGGLRSPYFFGFCLSQVRMVTRPEELSRPLSFTPNFAEFPFHALR